MLVFTFTLFPIFFAYFWATKKINPLVAIFSLSCASVVAISRGFFCFPKILAILNFAQTTFTFFIPMVLIPAICYGIFLLFSKDDFNSKIEASFEFFMVFFCVTLPFETIRNFPIINFYTWLLRPLIYLSFILAINGEIKKLYEAVVSKDKPKLFFKITQIVFMAASCCILDATYFSRLNSVFAILLSVTFIAIFSFFTIKLNKNNTN